MWLILCMQLQVFNTENKDKGVNIMTKSNKKKSFLYEHAGWLALMQMASLNGF